jgi:hypothetical protein
MCECCREPFQPGNPKAKTDIRHLVKRIHILEDAPAFLLPFYLSSPVSLCIGRLYLLHREMKVQEGCRESLGEDWGSKKRIRRQEKIMGLFQFISSANSGSSINRSNGIEKRSFFAVEKVRHITHEGFVKNSR